MKYISKRDLVLCALVAALFFGGHLAVNALTGEVHAQEAEQEAVMDGPLDPMEPVLIEEALVEQGYYIEEIPLSYELQDHIQTACKEFGVPYHVALGLIETESSFNENTVSLVGAYGLCQLNPKYFPDDLDSFGNVWCGMEHLGGLMERHGLEKALVCYNMGEYGARGIESSAYSRNVLAAAAEWENVLKGAHHV